MYASQDPLSAFTSYQFDSVGNLILRTDARNWPTTYTMDALNRTVGTFYINSDTGHRTPSMPPVR